MAVMLIIVVIMATILFYVSLVHANLTCDDYPTFNNTI